MRVRRARRPLSAICNLGLLMDCVCCRSAVGLACHHAYLHSKRRTCAAGGGDFRRHLSGYQSGGRRWFIAGRQWGAAHLHCWVVRGSGDGSHAGCSASARPVAGNRAGRRWNSVVPVRRGLGGGRTAGRSGRGSHGVAAAGHRAVCVGAWRTAAGLALLVGRSGGGIDRGRIRCSACVNFRWLGRCLVAGPVGGGIGNGCSCGDLRRGGSPGTVATGMAGDLLGLGGVVARDADFCRQLVGVGGTTDALGWHRTPVWRSLQRLDRLFPVVRGDCRAGRRTGWADAVSPAVFGLGL